MALKFLRISIPLILISFKMIGAFAPVPVDGYPLANPSPIDHDIESVNLDPIIIYYIVHGPWN